jgi:hypothetical protein
VYTIISYTKVFDLGRQLLQTVANTRLELEVVLLKLNT